MASNVDKELESLWRAVRRDLEASLPNSTLELWLDPLRVVSARGSTLLVTAPKSVRTWVERRYYETLLGRYDQNSHRITGVPALRRKC